MKMAFIGSPTTLKNCLRDLVEWGIIEVLTVGKNDWSGPTKVKLAGSFLNKHCTGTEGQLFISEQLLKASCSEMNSNYPATEIQLFRNEQLPEASSTIEIAVQQPNTTKASKPKKGVPTPETKVAFRYNVQLLQTEFDTLVGEFGPAFTGSCLDKLSNYKLSSGKTYKSDYGAIRQWVIEALQDKQNRSGSPVAPAATTAPPPPKDRPLR